MSQRVLFFEFWNCTPHLQTALELALEHEKDGDRVHFFFGGHDSSYIENVNFNKDPNDSEKLLPEEAAKELIRKKNIKFHLRVSFASVKFQIPDNFNSLEQLLEFKYKDFFAGRAAASSLMFHLGSASPDLTQYASLIRLMIKSGIEVYEYTKKIIQDNHIDLVYVFNGRFCNQAALAAGAKSLNVKVLYHERGANKTSYFLEDYQPHDTLKAQHKMTEVWQSVSRTNFYEAKKVACAFYEETRSGKEIGWKSYIGGQIKDALPKLDRSKKIVTYFSSCDDEFVALRDLYVWRYWKDQYTALQELIRVCNSIGNIDLHIRLHPNLKNKDKNELSRWVDFQGIPGVNLILPTSEVDTYRLIEESEVVVVAGSTVGIESVYWGTPSINLGPAYYSELNAVYHPKSNEELQMLLTSNNLDAHREKAFPFGYHCNTFGHPFKIYRPIDLDTGKFLGVDLSRYYSKKSKFQKIIDKIGANLKVCL